MSNSNAPPQTSSLHDRWNQYQRSSYKATKCWSCPLCEEKPVFQSDTDLYSHIYQNHADYREYADTSKGGNNMANFRLWLDQVLARDQEEGNLASRTADIPIHIGFKASLDSHVYVQGTADTADPKRARAHRTLSTSPGKNLPGRQSREISDIEKLSLSQDQDFTMADTSVQHELSSPPLSPLGSRKRTAGTQLSPHNPSSKLRSPDRAPASNPTRVKSRPNGPQFGAGSPWKRQVDPEFVRSVPVDGEGELARAASGPKRLFNPTTDNPTLRSDVTKVLDPANLAPAAIAPRGYDKPAQSHRQKAQQVSRKREAKPSKEVYSSTSGKPAHRNSPQQARPVSRDNANHPYVVTQHPRTVQSEAQPLRQDDRNLGLVLQPETRPISQEQLVAEVKGIYAGLVMVEAKCVDVDNKQARDAQEAEPGQQPKLNNEQWQALIALHRTLLHEHHDFFLASQHPSASPALRRLASKYAMPARMWRHGIHSFLELLRHRLPDSLEHMLAFIYLAYSMMALLYETVPTFEDTWIECLGDLGRYRMAIEDDDIRDREVWTGVAKFWYSKAADKSPNVGRLYHHLAILARPNALQQLYYYTRSLSCAQPFLSARESILTLFDPILGGTESTYHRSLPVDTAFIKAHGFLFTGVGMDQFYDVVDQFLGLLDNHISRVTAKWKEQGIYIAVANYAAMFGYASKENLLRRTYAEGQNQESEALRSVTRQLEGSSGIAPSGPGRQPEQQGPVSFPPANNSDGPSDHQHGPTQSLPALVDSLESSKEEAAFAHAMYISFTTLDLVLQRVNDPNILPHVHLSLVFMYHIHFSEPAIRLVEQEFPWESLVVLLNSLITFYDTFERMETNSFPEPEKGVGRPLSDDFNIRGLEWAQSYFPSGWFENALVDDEERTLELASMAADRRERILWLAYRLAQHNRRLRYDSGLKQFSVAPDPTRVGGPAEGAIDHKTVPSTSVRDDDIDTEMSGTVEAEEEPQDLENDSPEMRELRLQQYQLRKQLKTGTMEAPEESLPVLDAYDVLRPFYTVMVCDTNLFLRQLDVFWLMADTAGWPVVIPNSVITELTGLSKNTTPVGREADGALRAIKSAIDLGRDITIVTSKGNNVTRQGNFFKEQIESYEGEGRRNLDEIIIQTTKQQAQLKRGIHQSADGDSQRATGRAKPAVLVTEDRAMRVKASAYGVASVAASMVRRVIVPRRKRDSHKDSGTSP